MAEDAELTRKDEMSMTMMREKTSVMAMSWPIDTANGNTASRAPLSLTGEISDTYVWQVVMSTPIPAPVTIFEKRNKVRRPVRSTPDSGET